MEPHTIRFEQNSWGKPRIAGASPRPVSFSVSHTDGLSVIAISDGRNVGIDVERNRAVADRDRVARDAFGASTARALSRLHAVDRDGAFLRLWTAAEAFLKATGTGFAGRDASIPLSLSEATGVVRLDHAGAAIGEASLKLMPLSLPDQFFGSVVLELDGDYDGEIVPELIGSSRR